MAASNPFAGTTISHYRILENQAAEGWA